MKAMIRNDLINLETFVQARFHFDYFLKAIYSAGGYIFLYQFDYHWKDEGGSYLAERMVKAGLLSTKSYSNYKFGYLTETALKYLIYGDSEMDFSGVPKNKIYVSKLTDTPSDKQLFSSAMKFPFMLTENPSTSQIGKSGYRNKLINNLHLGFPKNVLNTENMILSFNNIFNKCMNYFDISKIVVFPFLDNAIDIIIFDCGECKSTNYYFKLHRDLTSLLPNPQLFLGKLKYVIVSYSEKRAEALSKQFNEAREKREKAIITLRKAKGGGKNQAFIQNLQKLVDNIPEEFTVKVNSKAFYLNDIKGGRVMRKNTESIKLKDKKAAKQMQKEFAKKRDNQIPDLKKKTEELPIFN